MDNDEKDDLKERKKKNEKKEEIKISKASASTQDGAQKLMECSESEA